MYLEGKLVQLWKPQVLCRITLHFFTLGSVFTRMQITVEEALELQYIHEVRMCTDTNFFISIHVSSAIS